MNAVNQTSNTYSVVLASRTDRSGNDARYLRSDKKWEQIKGDPLVSINFWGFTPSIFKHLEKHFINFLKVHRNNNDAEFFLPTVIGDLINNNIAEVTVLSTQDEWFGVTHHKDVELVKSKIADLVRTGHYPSTLWPLAID